MAYKHKVVTGLAQLIEKYGGGGHDPVMRAVWYGIKSQVPMLLEALDNSEEAIKLIEDKLREVLDIAPEPEPEDLPTGEFRTEPTVESLKSTETGLEIKVKKVKKAPPKRKRTIKSPPKPRPVAEAEVTVEPEVNCNHCQFSNENDLCDKGHIERQPGKAEFASQCQDFKAIVKPAEEVEESS